MSTVVRRTFVSTPSRDAYDTWIAIVDLLAGTASSPTRDALLAVAGPASSVISDQAPKGAPIVATCDGPRTRIYCLYDEDAIEGADRNEAALGFDPLKGDWAISLPCLAEDLDWVQAALARHGSRVTARDAADGLDTAQKAEAASLTFDPAGFLGS